MNTAKPSERHDSRPQAKRRPTGTGREPSKAGASPARSWGVFSEARNSSADDADRKRTSHARGPIHPDALWSTCNKGAPSKLNVTIHPLRRPPAVVPEALEVKKAASKNAASVTLTSRFCHAVNVTQH